jgi:N-acyl-phosphatidylethanolamine-hydrolysing phospholipase D
MPRGRGRDEWNLVSRSQISVAWRRRGTELAGEPFSRSLVTMRAHVAVAVASLAVLTADVVPTWAGAPRDGKRFVNSAGAGERGNFFLDMFPFLLRMAGRTLVDPDGAPPVVPFDPAAIAKNPSITWIGHSTMLVRMDGVTFLTDPIFSDRASPVSFAGPRRVTPPGIPLEALPEIDFVLLSHDHYDHTDFDSIEHLAALGIPFVVPIGLGEIVREAGGEAIELDWWGETERDGLRLVCVPAQHFSGRSLVDTDRRLWAGWVVVGPTRRFYHAGDTGYFDGFREIGARFGPIDLAAIPIGAYRPEQIMRWVHLDPEEALQAAEDVRATSVVPMHFGTFDLTEEPLDEPPARFRLEASRRNLDTARVRVLAIGETRDF